MPLNKYQLPEGRRIKVYRSGDPYYKGATFTINPRQIRNLDVFIKDCAEKVNAPWGAIRSIHTPNTGTVVKDLSDLQKKGHYVAAGQKGFFSIPGGYENIGRPGFAVAKGKHKVIHKPVPKIKEINIRLFRNGDAYGKPILFKLTKTDIEDWDRTLDKISDQAQLKNGRVKRLYTIEGKILRRPSDLKHNESYVVSAANESFKKFPYQEQLLAHGADYSKAKVKAKRKPPISDVPRNAEINKRKPQKRSTKKEGKTIDRPISSNKKSNKKKGPSITASKINRARQYHTKPLSSKAAPEKSEEEGRKFSTNKQTPLFSNHDGEAPSSTSYKSTDKELNNDEVVQDSTPEEGQEDTPEESQDSAPEEDIKPFKNTVDHLDSSQTSIDYLNIQTDKMITNSIQESPLISKTKSSAKAGSRMNSPMAASRQSESRLGTTYSYQEVIEEENERYLDPGTNEPTSVDGTMSRLSLIDSGHASLLSDDDGMDSIFRAKLKSRPTTTLEVDYDTDDSGLYRAKSRNLYTRGATTVADSTETKIEIPLDLVEASEVQEEAY